MVLEDNNVRVDGKEDPHHANRRDVYNSEKKALIKDGYIVEVTYKEGKKIIWEVVNDNVVEEGVKHEEVGI